MTDNTNSSKWEKIKLNVRKWSVVAIGTDEWNEPIPVFIWAPLGKHARIHYPTYYPNIEAFMKFREDHWINLRIATDNELLFIEHFKHEEKLNAKYKEKFKFQTLSEAIKAYAIETAEKERQRTTPQEKEKESRRET